MEPALRPMSLGEILDRTAQLYRENFVLFAGIFVIYGGCALVLGLLLLALREGLRAANLMQALAWVRFSADGVVWLLLFLAAGAAVAAINRAVAWVHLGEAATIHGAYRSILPRLSRYLWLMTITFFVVWVPVALLYFGYAGFLIHYAGGLRIQTGAVTEHPHVDPHTLLMFGIISVVFVMLMIPAAIYTILMGLRYAMALPACVLEDLTALQALRRGIDLSKGSRGRIFVLGLLVGAIKVGIVGLSQSFILIAAFKHRGQMGAGLTAVSEVMSFFTNTFLGPIYATGITLLYYDQRVRREGYDIEWMMQAAGLTPPSAAVPAKEMAEEGTEMSGQNGADATGEPGVRFEGPEAEGAHG